MRKVYHAQHRPRQPLLALQIYKNIVLFPVRVENALEDKVSAQKRIVFAAQVEEGLSGLRFAAFCAERNSLLLQILLKFFWIV